MYDINKLKSDLSCIDVASECGLKIKKKGNNRYQMLCPAHNDKHFGSCYVYDKKWTCYACGAGGDVFDLITCIEGCDSKDSYRLAAAHTYNPNAYLLNDSSIYEEKERLLKFPIKDSDLKLLRLRKSGYIYDITSAGYEETSNTIDCEENDCGKIYLYGNKIKVSLYELWESDPEAFAYIIKGKCLEALDRIKLVIDSNILMHLSLAAELVYLLKNEFNGYVVRLNFLNKNLRSI